MSKKFQVNGNGYDIQTAFDEAIHNAQSNCTDKFYCYNFSFNLLEIKGFKSCKMDEERGKTDVDSDLEVILEIEDFNHG